MSLNRFKETLHACSSSSSQPSQTQPRSPPHPALLPRRPPKTSLSQQLLRLEAAASSSSSSFSSRPVQLPPAAPRPPIEKPREEDEPPSSEDDDERKSRPIIRRCLPPPPAAALESRGPYEPLVLSLPGEHPVVQVPPSINCRLLAHQRDGVRFLYNLYRNNHGGILGDDMGLGKTIQTIAFLSSVIGKGNGHEQSTNKGKKTGPVLILCPTSVIRNWENEFSEWAEFSVAVYHGPNRDLVLGKIETQGLEVLITSFDTFRIHDKILCGISWELVVVDEAHRLKNEKAKLYTACLGITTQKRFGLTGTIMQNKIMELFNLFDWVVPGCLGDREHFRAYYDEPLKQGQRLSAPERFVQVADVRKKHLVSVLRKFLLRRTKQETIGHLMLGKEDNIVFCKMSDVQKRVYRRMLQQPDIQILINRDVRCSCGSPLPQVECCKRTEPDGVIWSYLHRDNPDEGCSICPFCLVLPCLVKLQQISNHLELIKPNPKDEPEKQKKDAELAAAVFGADIDLVGGTAKSENFMGLSDAEHCGKMRALERLLSLWTQQGDKILLFSYSVRMLDILEKFLIRKGYCFSRFDGTTPMNARQSLVDEFNRSPSKQVFLISTRAGNLGVNLVSANRVVIFDPSWNPAQDLQAQDRSFRYGQRRHVTVFRLLGAGSLEELIYSRQIYKQQLSNIAVSGKIERRYFEGVQDDKKFQGELFGICNLFRDLSDKLFTSEIIEMHGEHGKSSATEATGIREIVDTDLFGSEENRTSTATTDTDNQKLDDFGIVYAHRNEDVVNMRTDEREKGGTNETVQSSLEKLHSKNETKHPVMEKSYSLEEKRKVARSYSLEQKKKEFSRIASFMGMDDLEFSRWLLSASPHKQSEVLQNYKRKKKSKCAKKQK